MILPGKIAITRGIILGLKDTTIQAQPCGVDLSLRKILQWTSAGTVDFSNRHRKGSRTEELAFTGSPKSIHLSTGSYMVEFNEVVNIPLNIMGQIFVRSSLWRTGALLSAGVVSFFVMRLRVAVSAWSNRVMFLDGQRLHRCHRRDVASCHPSRHHTPRGRETGADGFPRDVRGGRGLQWCLSGPKAFMINASFFGRVGLLP